MHWLFASLLLVIVTFSHAAFAQSPPLVRTVASHFVLQTNEGSCDETTCQVDYTLQCPAGYVASGYWVVPLYAVDVNLELTRDLIDSNKRVINRNTLSSAAPLAGDGYTVLYENEEHHQKEIEAIVTCLAMAATTDNTFALAKATATIGKLAFGTVTAFCPAESPVAVGGFSNADGRILLTDQGSGPVWGTSANPQFLADLPSGETTPPTGWRVKVYNNDFFSTPTAAVFAICGNVPALRTFVTSVPVPQPAFGSKTPFSIFAPVPDGWTAVGSGFDGGQYGDYFSSDVWMQDGSVVGMLQWFASSKGYDSGSAEVRAFITKGLGNAPSGATRAAMAVLAVPSASPAPTSVTIVEYYNAQLDHYFITGIPDEITKLDNGTFVGWARTGQTFKGYGIGSAGRTGRRPVCREYGNPLAGLNSHFYSASPDECGATLANGGGFSWLLEASEVFEMDLPDPVTGACPADGVPIYRVFNQRKDANHRYTTSIAIRNQMVAKGGIAEGYGPDAVALCGLQ